MAGQGTVRSVPPARAGGESGMADSDKAAKARAARQARLARVKKQAEEEDAAAAAAKGGASAGASQAVEDAKNAAAQARKVCGNTTRPQTLSSASFRVTLLSPPRRASCPAAGATARAGATETSENGAR